MAENSPAGGSRDPHAVGVSAAFLRDFATKVRKLGDTPTTKDVCDLIIVPETKERKCALVDLLGGKTDDTGRALLGRPTVFVSHAWRYTFETPLSVMLDYAKDHPDTYFWFDLFVNNQNIAADLPQEWWTTTFRTQIESIGKVVLVLSPWNDPVPLKRAWCLYEILCSLQGSGVEFLVKLPPEEVGAFHQGLLESFESAMDALVTTQAEKAEAFSATDKDMIFAAVRDTIGFPHLNELVKDQMREWFLQTGLEVAAEQERLGRGKDAEFGSLCNNLASMLKDFGDYEKALEYSKRSLKIRLETLGENHPDTATTYNNMASVYESQGEYAKALEYYKKGLKIRLATSGENHPDTAVTYYNMSLVLENDGDRPLAKEYAIKARDIFMATLGPDHPHTKAAQNLVARV
eukprot:UC1_evm1s2150